MHPKNAALEARRRVPGNTVEKHLLIAGGRPDFERNFYVWEARGEFAGASLPGARYTICTEAAGINDKALLRILSAWKTFYPRNCLGKIFSIG